MYCNALHLVPLIALNSIGSISTNFSNLTRNRYASILANASNRKDSSVFGPSENDIALLADGHTIISVIRMDGDGPCNSGSRKANGGTGKQKHCIALLSPYRQLQQCGTDLRIANDWHSAGGDYRYYAASFSTTGGLSWSTPEPIPGAGCARPRLLSLGIGKPLLLSGGRLCVENTTDLVWLLVSSLQLIPCLRHILGFASVL
eukprot:SAG31_NODE_4630_length_3085_cov_2.376758_2_plen_203_part_00